MESGPMIFFRLSGPGGIPEKPPLAALAAWQGFRAWSFLLLLLGFSWSFASGQSQTDAAGWTPWLSVDEVSPNVQANAAQRLLNQAEGRSRNGKAQFRLQWLSAQAATFEVRLVGREAQKQQLIREKEGTAQVLISQAQAKDGTGTTWWLGIWHQGGGAGWPPRLRELRARADQHFQKREYEEGLAAAKELVAYARAEHGPDHRFTGPAQAVLARAFQQLGKFEQAAAAAAEAARIATLHHGEKHSDTMLAERIRAASLRGMSRYAESLELYQRILAYYRETEGSPSPTVALLLTRMGMIGVDTGDLQGAQSAFLEALSIYEGLGASHARDVLDVKHNLGNVHRDLGDNARARALWEEILAADRQSASPNPKDTAATLVALGNLAMRERDFSRAESLTKEAVALIRKAEGGQGITVAGYLGDLSNVLAEAGRLDEAAGFLHEALEILGREYSGPHRLKANLLGNLARLEIERGRPTEAAPLAEQSRAMKEQLYGKDGAPLIAAHQAEAMAAFATGRHEAAAAATAEQLRLEAMNWERLTAFATPEQRATARRTLNPFFMAGSLGDADLMAQATLAFKGITLDADLQEHRLIQGRTLDAKDLKRIQRIKETLRARLLESGENSPPGEAQELRSLQNELETLQRRALGPARPTLSKTAAPEALLTEIRGKLPAATALLEFVRYRKWEPPLTFTEHYGVAIIAQSHAPDFVDLGPATVIEAEIRRFREIAGRPLNPEKHAELIAEANVTLGEACRALHGMLARPIEQALPADIRQLILDPDGELQFLPFACLLDEEERFWCTRYAMRHVSSGRDLLVSEPGPAQAGEAGLAVLVGNVNYLATPGPAPDDGENGDRGVIVEAAKPLSKGLAKELSILRFAPLSGTGEEIGLLEKRFQQKNWKRRILTGTDPTEAALRRLPPPTILHLATHGFFLPDAEPEEGAARTESDAMLRSGLALTGAQATVNEWKEGRVPRPSRDGILSAAEAAELSLDGTRLVALSACETALGESQGGEGVLGLKRAFAVAGARNLLITLWLISDFETISLMDRFYERLLDGESPEAALHTVQKEALVEALETRGLYQAVNLFGPFVLLGQGAGSPPR